MEIICGDCNQVMAEMPCEFIDLIVTDIPYGINYKSNCQNYDNHGPKSVKTTKEHYFSEIVGDSVVPINWLKEAYRVLKNNSALYIFCHWSKWHILYSAVEEVGFKIKNMIVMNKSNHGMGDLTGSFAPKHELLLFATKGRHILNFPEKRLADVWNVQVKFSGGKRFHPNEKPLKWIIPTIVNSSKEGDVVLDPFAGSGSVGVVCKMLNRKGILIDIDPQYVEIAKARISGETKVEKSKKNVPFDLFPDV